MKHKPKDYIRIYKYEIWGVLSCLLLLIMLAVKINE